MAGKSSGQQDGVEEHYQKEEGQQYAQRQERLGIVVERSIGEARIAELGIRSWPKWGCPPSKFPWTYEASETCYVVKGRVRLFPEGCCASEFVEIGPGDLAILPKGMCCTWDVCVALDKHYKFDPS